MTPEPDDSSEQWQRVGEVLSGYFAAIEGGEVPDRQALLQHTPTSHPSWPAISRNTTALTAWSHRCGPSPRRARR